MKTITQKEIEAGLRELGLRRGDAVEVHSSLSSFGWVEGGATAVHFGREARCHRR